MSTKQLMQVITKGLLTATPENLKLPKTTKGGKLRYQTLGEFYREYSAGSLHKLDVSESTLIEQFKHLLRTTFYKNEAGELVPLYPDNDADRVISKLASKFKSNILSLALSKNLIVEGDTVLIANKKNNFEAVRSLVNEAAGKAASAYDLDLFIGETLSEEESELKNIVQTKELLSATGKKAKFGFDIGHAHSNISSALGTIVVNSIRKANLEDTEKQQVLGELNKLLDTFKSEEAISGLMNSLGTTDRDLVTSCIDVYFGYTRKYLNGEINATFKVEPKRDSTLIRKVATSVADIVYPQAATANQIIGASLEKSISNHLTLNGNGYFIRLINEWILGRTSLPGVEEVGGSPSVNQMILEGLEAEILGKANKHSKGYNTDGISKAKPKAIKGIKSKPGTNTTSKRSINKTILRTPRGQFTSLVSIQSLIQLALYETIKKNMVDPALNFRSGRLAGSVQLQSLVQDRTGGLTAFLTYMKYPYGTFEPGFAQGSVDRSPTLLIDRSVREIALKLVTARMKTVVI